MLLLIILVLRLENIKRGTFNKGYDLFNSHIIKLIIIFILQLSWNNLLT